MKYIARVEPRDPGTRADSPDGNDRDGYELVELTGVERALIPTGSDRWLLLLVGVAVALIGFGFVGHVSGPRTPDPVRASADGGAQVSVAHTGTTEGSGGASEADDPSIVVTAPTEGATITGGPVVTGGVVVVEAIARRPLGTVKASVSIGGAILGWRDVNVDTAGPLEIRIPVFPPAFGAPVVLRLAAVPTGGQQGFAFSRGLQLDIPSAVGFWDALPTGTVDRAGRVQMLIRGYAPRAARTAEIAIQDGRGVVVATTSALVSYDSSCPGSQGGRMLGLGSFVARLWLPAGSRGPWTLAARWRDAATGLQLHVETSLRPIPELDDRLFSTAR